MRTPHTEYHAAIVPSQTEGKGSQELLPAKRRTSHDRHAHEPYGKLGSNNTYYFLNFIYKSLFYRI